MPPSLTTEAKTLKPWTAEYRGTKSDFLLGKDYFRVGPSDVVDDPESPAVRVFGPLKNEWANLITSAINERSSLLSLIEDMAKALEAAKKRMRNCRGAIESNQVVDKDTRGSLTNGMADLDAALSRYTEFMEQNNA